MEDLNKKLGGFTYLLQRIDKKNQIKSCYLPNEKIIQIEL